MAIPNNSITRIIGYSLKKSFNQRSTPNLQQRIAVFGEANEANQAVENFDQGIEITSAAQAAEIWGSGSPMHREMLVLRPIAGGGVGTGVVVVGHPQKEDAGGVAQELEITVTGAATANVTHFLQINGKTSENGASYSFNVVNGDTPTIIAVKIKDVVTSVISSPISSPSTALGVATVKTKWKGLTANEVDVQVLTGGVAAGVTYAVAQTVAGLGTPDLTDAITSMVGIWNTLIINPYNTTAVLDLLESTNGTPEGGDGNFAAENWRPFVALTGNSSNTLTDYTTEATARRLQQTNAFCPAPNSLSSIGEISAAYAAVFAPIMADKPHLDATGNRGFLKGIHVGLETSPFYDYINRISLVKNGVSTVNLVAGQYQIQEMITTYHPEGEEPAQYSYVADLVGVDFNFKYTLDLLEGLHVIDKVIAKNEDIVEADDVIKPKQWNAIVNGAIKDMVKRAIIVDSQHSIDSIQVGISETNPNRLDTAIDYKRRNYGRVVDSIVSVGFNFGN